MRKASWWRSASSWRGTGRRLPFGKNPRHKKGWLLALPPFFVFPLSVLPVHCHHAGATDTDVVLQCDAGTFHLTFVGLAAQLPYQLGALRQTGCAHRMTFRQQGA